MVSKSALAKFVVFGVLGFSVTSCVTSSSSKLSEEASKPIDYSLYKGAYKVGKPYKISGTWYHPREEETFEEIGAASWYGKEFAGKPTANGEIFDPQGLTAAHKTLPLPSIVKVTNLANDKSIIVKVNDRGPFSKNRVLDLSEKAAEELGFKSQGTAEIKMTLLTTETERLYASIKNKDNSYDLVKFAPSQSPSYTASSTVKEEVASNDSSGQDSYLSSAMGVENLNNNDSLASNEELKTSSQDNLDENQAKTDKTNQLSKEVASASSDISETTEYVSDNMKVKFTGNNLFIQAGSYGIRDNAYKAIEKLQNIDNVILANTYSNDGKTLYRVLVGPIDSSEQAETKLAMVKEHGYADALIISK